MLVGLVLLGFTWSTVQRAHELENIRAWLFRRIELVQAIDGLHATYALTELYLYKFVNTGDEQYLKWTRELVDSFSTPFRHFSEDVEAGSELGQSLQSVVQRIDKSVVEDIRTLDKESEAVGGDAARRRLKAHMNVDLTPNYVSADLVKARRSALQELVGKTNGFVKSLANIGGSVLIAVMMLLLLGLLALLRLVFRERKKAEDAIRQSEKRIRTVVENMFDSLITFDETGRIQSANKRTEQLFGFEEGEMEGRKLSSLFPERLAPSIDSIGAESSEIPLGKVEELKARNKEGEQFPVELVVSDYHSAEGHGFLATIRDISERYEVARMKREFVAMVSHELRTPLTSIRGSLGLAAAGVLGSLPEKAEKSIKLAERNTVRLITIINDLLDLEKLASDKLEMHFGAFKIGNVLDKSVESVRAFAEENKVDIDFEMNDTEVYGDEDRLVQVVVNFLSNAIKFSPSGGTVELVCNQTNGNLRVAVIDEGPGIPDQYKGLIFERFQQISAQQKGKKGTGLGLAICKAIIEQHNGNIGVDSIEGNGSTFWFQIPIMPDEVR